MQDYQWQNRTVEGLEHVDGYGERYTPEPITYYESAKVEEIVEKSNLLPEEDLED